MGLTDPSQVSLTHSYPAMVDSSPPRSRNASNDKLIDNSSSIHIGLGNTPSRVSLGTVLACQPTNINDSHATINTQLTHQNLQHQKEQMQKNNEDLYRYMEFRKDLEKAIKKLEKENEKLRRERQQHGSDPSVIPEIKKRDHRRQKEISALHAEIVKSQRS